MMKSIIWIVMINIYLLTSFFVFFTDKSDWHYIGIPAFVIFGYIMADYYDLKANQRKNI